MTIDLSQLSARINSYSVSVFRLETLDFYASASDGGDVARYLAGDAEPDPARKEPWLDRLRAEHAQGRRRQRVHVLRSPVTPYLRYECEWGYLPNSAAGEDIGILDLAERPLPPTLEGIGDFWLIDDATPVLMTYGPDGRFAQADVLPDSELPRYLAARDAAIAAAEPFTGWWQRHPGYHQANQAA